MKNGRLVALVSMFLLPPTVACSMHSVEEPGRASAALSVPVHLIDGTNDSPTVDGVSFSTPQSASVARQADGTFRIAVGDQTAVVTVDDTAGEFLVTIAGTTATYRMSPRMLASLERESARPGGIKPQFLLELVLFVAMLVLAGAIGTLLGTAWNDVTGACNCARACVDYRNDKEETIDVALEHKCFARYDAIDMDGVCRWFQLRGVVVSGKDGASIAQTALCADAN